MQAIYILFLILSFPIGGINIFYAWMVAKEYLDYDRLWQQHKWYCYLYLISGGLLWAVAFFIIKYLLK